MRFLLAIVVSLLWSNVALADSWHLPTPSHYFSSDKRFRFEVTPRALEDTSSYFEDEVNGKEPAGQRERGPRRAEGRLQRLTDEGNWTLVWGAPLVNDVAPVTALVVDGGRYVVTFDNWHQVGFGNEAVVIYAADGRLVRALSLTDILPEDYVWALPRSVSSIWWHGKDRIIGDTLVLRVVIPEGKPFHETASFVDLRIDLATGQPEAKNNPEWHAALNKAAPHIAAIREKRLKAIAMMKAPLLGPRSDKDIEWHRYLREAFLRTSADWKTEIPSTGILKRPDATDYLRSRSDLAAQLRLNGFERQNLMFASPSQENLAAVIAAEAKEISNGKLKGIRLYVALESAFWPKVRNALLHTEATVIQVDPTKPIPQRPELLPK